MDIYAKQGTKIKYTGKGGYDSDKEYANKHLSVNEVYTVCYIDVGGWRTEVYLEELPNLCFNSVHFEEV